MQIIAFSLLQDIAQLILTRKVLGQASFLIHAFLRSTKLRAMLKVNLPTGPAPDSALPQALPCSQLRGASS